MSLSFKPTLFCDAGFGTPQIPRLCQRLLVSATRGRQRKTARKVGTKRPTLACYLLLAYSFSISISVANSGNSFSDICKLASSAHLRDTSTSCPLPSPQRSGLQLLKSLSELLELNHVNLSTLTPSPRTQSCSLEPLWSLSVLFCFLSSSATT